MSLAPQEQQTQPIQDNNEELLALLALLFSITRGRWPTSNKVKRDVLDRLALKAKLEMRRLGNQLTEGDITEQQFVVGMESLLVQGHTGAAVLWEEGPENFGPVSRDIVERNVSEQDTFLAGFTLAIAANQLSDAQIIGRAGSYGPSLRTSYFDNATVDGQTDGFDQEQNILNPADHCTGAGSCIEQTNRGIVPIGTLIPIGGRVCGPECQCDIRQINSTTGEVRIV